MMYRNFFPEILEYRVGFFSMLERCETEVNDWLQWIFPILTPYCHTGNCVFVIEGGTGFSVSIIS